MTALLEAALALARAGVPVFPCGADKQPLTTSGFKDAAADVEQVARWWREHPDALVGVPCGAPSGLWAADLDVDKATGEHLGEAAVAALGIAPPPYVVRTRSGGAHWLYRHRNGLPGNTAKRLAGVDTRGSGGYIIAWDPDTLLDALRDPDTTEPPAALLAALARPKPQPNGTAYRFRPGTAPTWAEAALEGEAAKVAHAPEGCRNDTLNRAAFNLGQIVAGAHLDQGRAEAELTAAAISCGLEPDEIADTIHSGMSKGRASPRGPRAGNGPGPKGDGDMGHASAADDHAREDAADGEDARTSGAPIPSLHDFRDIALRFLAAYVHADGWTIAERQGEVFTWGGAHWTAHEHNEFASRIRLWLEEQTTIIMVTDPKTDPKTKDLVPKVVPVRPNRKLVAEVEASIRARVRRTDTTVPAHIIVVKNGILDMRTGELRAHTPRLFNTVSIDATWRLEFETAEAGTLIAAIDGTAFGDFLENITGHEPKQKATLGEFWGYSLTSDTSEHKTIAIIGVRRSGKGTLFWLMRRMQRDLVVSMTAKRLSGSMPLQPCIGKNVMQVPDMRLPPKLDTSDLVELLLSLSGEDGFNIARKFLVDWEGALTLKVWIAANLMPLLVDDAGVLASRMIFVHLPVSFYDREDKHLRAKLAPLVDQVLAWAVGHWRQLKQRGHFTTGPSHTTLSAQMECRQSPLAPFLRKRIEFTGKADDVIVKEDVYLTFRADAAEFGVTEFTRNALTRALAKQVPPIVQAQAQTTAIGSHYLAKRRVYRGIKWRDGHKPTLEEIKAWAEECSEPAAAGDD